MSFSFEIIKKSDEAKLARAGIIHTPHGDIKTPAFITVGTKATVKSLTPEQVRDYVGAEAVLANTYHLYLQPGDEIVAKHGGFAKMMNWVHKTNNEERITKNVSPMPTFSDSGGFQVFSLGQALGHGVSKIATSEEISKRESESNAREETHEKLAKIDDDGVTFKSVIDGSTHRFTPEISMNIQHNLGADIFFAFDECTSPLAPIAYQREAIARTHAWAKRSLDEHKRLGVSKATGEMQALFGVVQGGAYEELRKESATVLGAMDFDGYGIGGSFTKEDMGTAVKWVNEILPEGKPRHLLGIGEPMDILMGIENGIDTFDCVAPTRIARNGAIYTKDGRINITNAIYKNDMSSMSDDESWYTHQFTKSYLNHLFKADEMLAATLASIHNLKFLTTLCEEAREAIIAGNFLEFKEEFIKRYYKNYTKSN
ncbi:TPA: tRNA guanosine(34) transglycosylase Tgt [Candidatus Nomurabacteria bacterium]|nr:tRNA guanosine(34) transglycosylase Tgt [Candidatus Nomurabacteria bacterium]